MSLFEEMIMIAEQLDFEVVIDHENENECFAVIHDGRVKTHDIREAHSAPGSKTTQVITTYGPVAVIFFGALSQELVWVFGYEGKILGADT